PLGATVWLTAQLLNQSLRLSPVNQLSDLSHSLEKTGKEYYQQAKDQLKADARAGHLAPVLVPNADELLSSEDNEAFTLTGEGGSQLLYVVRTPEGVVAWQRPLGVRMG